MRRALAVALLAVSPSLALGGGSRPVLPPFPEPHLYGRVVLDHASRAAGVAPVAFDHWRHRTLFTCRLCHVDVGFAMEAGGSGISAATNARGVHCGACHDGKTVVLGTPVFRACAETSARPLPRDCERCHRSETDAEARARYEAFARKKPLDGAGLVDWEVLEGRLFEKPADYLEGVSTRRDRLRNDEDLALPARGTWLGDIAFSHRKHAAWTGCEGCHPEVFPSLVRGALRYDMKALVAGRYCGACHGKVAFPLASCMRCHRAGGT